MKTMSYFILAYIFIVGVAALISNPFDCSSFYKLITTNATKCLDNSDNQAQSDRCIDIYKKEEAKLVINCGAE